LLADHKENEGICLNIPWAVGLPALVRTMVST